MKKSILAFGFAALISAGTVLPAFAAWEAHDAGWKYQLDGGTYAANGWQQVGDYRYYFDENGVMKTGWLTLKKKSYHLDEATGSMNVRWWQDTDGQWYYFDDQDGDMLINTRTPDGFYVNKQGVFDPSKGNSLDKSYGVAQGPSKKIEEEVESTMLGGISFPTLSKFATDKLTAEGWGVEGSIEAFEAYGVILMTELQAAGIDCGGRSPFYITENTITYAPGGLNSPKLKLVKTAEYYEIHDYGSFDEYMKNVLLAMSSLISTKPHQVYNTIHTTAEYNQQYLRETEYKKYGDAQFMYRAEDGYFAFLVKAI